ncbi:MAG: hypothetical protein KQA31_02820 [Candidatus Aenigmarchaeota archaeon]|nr:hypothetical protein [Candidatus Aenigmarchaeota archaeon]
MKSYKARSNNGEEFNLYLVSCLIMDQEDAAERARIEFRKKPHEMTYDEIKRAHNLTGKEYYNFWSTQLFRIGQILDKTTEYEIPEENSGKFEILDIF